MSYGAKLPLDLLVDILYRLPPKSLCRFKSVSKSFLLLISGPDFHQSHLDRINNKRERVIFYSDCLYSVDCTEASNNDAVIAMKHDFFSIADPDEFDILGSCNGLILVSDGDGVKLLLNPSTREGKELPASPFGHDSVSGYTMYGLGYDSSADDYVVVAIDVRDDDDDDDDDESCCTTLIVSVYSLKTDSWRRIQDVPHYHPHLRPSSLVLVNGSLHWLSYTSSGYVFVIAAFDVADEKFRVVQTPTAPDHSNFLCFNLGVFGGCLCMLVSHNANQTDVWMMKEHGVTDSWTKFTIDAHNLYKMEPLCFLVGKEVLLEMNGEKLVALNAKEKTSRDIVMCGIPDVLKPGMTYVESLISPYRNCNCGCRIPRNNEECENMKNYQLDSLTERCGGQKQTPRSTVAVAMSYGAKLPLDLLVDILYRLPPKSLCRFKSVSKSFLLLISGPDFHQSHLDRINNKRERVIFYSDCLYSVDCTEASNNDAVIAMKHDFFSIADPDGFDILGSCNGLILVIDRDGFKDLLNPSTREGKELPTSPFGHDSISCYTMFGLGYDSSADDYMVVAIDVRDDDDDDDDDESCCTTLIVSVYSLKTDSWRRIQDVPHYHPHLRPSSLVLVNGSLHWLSYTSSGYVFVIAAFDVADEKFRVVQTPTSPDHSKFLCFNLGVFGGCLCMLVSHNANQTDVWMMKEYGVTDSWTKFTIDAHNLYKMEPLCFLVGEEVLLEMNGEKLVALNAKEKTSRDIVMCGIPDVLKPGMTYVESLISPNRSCNCGCRIPRNNEECENMKSYQPDWILESMIEPYRAWIEESVGKAKRYKLDSSSSSRSIEASNSITDQFSPLDFLDYLKSIGILESPIYEKALKMFEDPYWREKLISMLDKKKRY